MCSSEDAKRFAQDRIQWVLEHQCRIPIRKNTPITFYYKTSDNLIDEADYHYKTHQYEESFILYSRYITLFVEELKKYHPHFADAPVNERERVKEIIRAKAFPRAEELKAKLKEKYAREYEEKQKLVHEDMIRIPSPIPMNNVQENSPNVPGTQPSPLQNHPIENYHIEAAAKDHPHGKQHSSLIKPIFDRFQKSTFIKTSLNSFRPMSIPKDIKSKFLQVAQNNTNKSIETCGILAGKRNEKNQYVLTHIVLPKQNGGPDSCDTEKEEEMLEYISTHDLITLGWIHTHPSQTVFLSSVDLHTHLSYQMLMQEAVAIVISPKYDEIGIFSLTPETGIPTISTCQKSGFHEHMNNPPLYTVSTHATYDSNLQCQIVDLRQ